MRVNMCAIICTILGSVLWTSGAGAATIHADPFGSADSVGYVGANHITGEHFLIWASGSSCHSPISLGGSAGFSDDFIADGLDGDDFLYIVEGSMVAFCGMWLQPPNYNGHFFDLRGYYGNDELITGSGDTWLEGEGGDDWMRSDNPLGHMTGWIGNDTLIVFGSGSGGVFRGGPGDDCLQIEISGTPFETTCDDGNDLWQGSGTMPFDCETEINWSCFPL
jgi:hypothetical protein